MTNLLLPAHIWRPVPRWGTFYEASTNGNIRSLPKEIVRKNGRKQTFKGRLLTANSSGDGYRKVTFSHLDKREEKSLHILIWNTFKGKIPDGMEINHKDGNKANNALCNLECVTHSQNIIHSYKELKRAKPWSLKNKAA